MADPFQMGQTPQMNFQIPQGASLPAMPVGAMAGGMQVQNQQRMEQFAEMQKKANLMSLAQQLMQAQEYQQNQAWRDAERGAGIEKANVSKDFGRREAAARVGTAETEAKLKSGTLESDISAGKAKNESIVSEAQMKKMENFVEDLNVNAANWNPATASVEFDKMAESHGIPKDHPIRARMAAAKSPQEFQMMLKGMSAKMVSSIAQQRAMQVETAKEEAAFKRTKYTADTQERIHAADAAARVTAATNKNAKQIGKLEAVATRQLDEVMAAKAKGDQAGMKRAYDELQFTFQMMERLKAAGAPTQLLPGNEGIVQQRPQPTGLPQLPGQTGGNRPPLDSFGTQ